MDSFNIHNYFKRGGKTVVLTLRQGDEEQRQWADKDVTDLFKLMKHFHPEFQNERRRKKDVWDELAQELEKLGYAWSSEDCRKKWSNMIRTFKVIEEQKHNHSPTYQSKRAKWQLYDAMLELLTLENAEAFPEAANVIQLIHKPLQNLRLSRKTSVPQQHRHQQQQLDNNIVSQSLQFDTRDGEEINLVSEADLIEMGVQLDHQQESIAVPVSQADQGILFSQPSAYKPPVNIPGAPSVISKSSFSVRPRKRPLVKKKRSKKESSKEETMDSLMATFIETTKTQQEEMLQKMTTFHSNALVLMQERNDLLRDIRNSLNSEQTPTATETGGTEEDPQNTVTFHLGPAFSISGNEQTTDGNLSSALVITNPSQGLPTFQLEDGTVLSSLGGDAADKATAVLTNLATFGGNTEIQESLLHSGLVAMQSSTVQQFIKKMPDS